MKMKKMLVIMTLVVSATSFANMNGQSANTGKQKVMKQEMEQLTKEQQKEFQEMVQEARKKIQTYKLQIEEIDIQMKKELLKDEPNIKKLDKLSEKKASFKTKAEKYMIQHKVEVKEKFGMNALQGRGRKNKSNLQGRDIDKGKRDLNQKEKKPENQEKNQRQGKAQRGDMKINQEAEKDRLNIRKIDIEIRLEMMSEKPDMSKIEKLIENKSEIESEMEKNRLRRKIERKEKVIEFMNGNDQGPLDKANI